MAGNFDNAIKLLQRKVDALAFDAKLAEQRMEEGEKAKSELEDIRRAYAEIANAIILLRNSNANGC